MTDEVPPYVRFLATAIEAAVDDMVKSELIELTDEQRLPLIAELIAKAAHAETPKRMLKALKKGLLDSDNVEEIFATDGQIKDLFKQHVDK